MLILIVVKVIVLVCIDLIPFLPLISSSNPIKFSFCYPKPTHRATLWKFHVMVLHFVSTPKRPRSPSGLLEILVMYPQIHNVNIFCDFLKLFNLILINVVLSCVEKNHSIQDSKFGWRSYEAFFVLEVDQARHLTLKSKIWQPCSKKGA
jgi:hypothetical protein